MPVVFRQVTYKRPGVYQWQMPNPTPGAGPLGSTYLETIVTCIGAGSGGASGQAANVAQVEFTDGGAAGNAGGYVQATFPAAAFLETIKDIVVGRGTSGGTCEVDGSGGIAELGPIDSLVAGNSTFGSSVIDDDTFITCFGGQKSTTGIGGGAGSSNDASQRVIFMGGTAITIDSVTSSQPDTGPGVFVAGSLATWNPTGNNAGGGGGTVDLKEPPVAGKGGGVNFKGGGIGNAGGGAGEGGFTPGSGGGASLNDNAGNTVGGDGADAIQNTGSGGGGGGGSATRHTAGSGVIKAGSGGRGSDGLVQVTDVWMLPVPPPPYVFNLEVVAWYHMMNMARPISLTGRYQS